ncbi:MAG: hypothetical protein ACTSRU_21715 [Candidatus Hodarchaeales archaeon]
MNSLQRRAVVERLNDLCQRMDVMTHDLEKLRDEVSGGVKE